MAAVGLDDDDVELLLLGRLPRSLREEEDDDEEEEEEEEEPSEDEVSDTNVFFIMSGREE